MRTAAIAGASCLSSGARPSTSSAPAGVARLEQQVGKPGDGVDLVGRLLQHRVVDVGGGLQVARVARLLGRGKRLGDLRLAAILADELLDELADLAFRHGAHEAVDRLAVLEGDDRRNRLDAELAGDRRMLVDVHLDQLDPAAGRGDDLFQRRLQLLAGAAPRRPEIDQHRLLARFLDDVGGEARGRGVLDDGGGAAAAAGAGAAGRSGAP